MIMNNFVSAVATAMICSTAIFVGCIKGEKYTNDVNDLPQSAQTVVKSHFSDHTVAQITIDDDEYEVQFTNGAKVEFSKKGELRNVDSAPGDSVSSALIPTAIKEYVDNIYPDQHIIKYEIGRRENEVKLSTGIELEFSKDGQFLRIDDDYLH